MQKLKHIMKLLERGEKLPEKNKDRYLAGNYAECRGPHVQSDCLLVYQLFDNNIIFIRNGNHFDIFS